MSAAVVVPWRDIGCEYRARALVFVIARLAPLGWPVVIGRHETGAWCKAQAVSDALAQTQAAVLIVHDADVWTDGLPEAVQRVQEGAKWAVPHRGLSRLDEAATARFMEGDTNGRLTLAERPYLGVECGGAFVIRRDVYEDCPLDRRFLGFGGEDESLSFALRVLHGPPVRLKHSMTHLWHPPQERLTRAIGSMASRDLRKRYAHALRSESAMRALVEEGKAHDAHRSAESSADADPALR